MNTYNLWEHNSWGNKIDVFDWDKRTIVGWMQVKPEVGDEIRIKMQSGKIGRFSITSVETYLDPKDMFFAQFKEIGYLNSNAGYPFYYPRLTV